MARGVGCVANGRAERAAAYPNANVLITKLPFVAPQTAASAAAAAAVLCLCYLVARNEFLIRVPKIVLKSAHDVSLARAYNCFG